MVGSKGKLKKGCGGWRKGNESHKTRKDWVGGVSGDSGLRPQSADGSSEGGGSQRVPQEGKIRWKGVEDENRRREGGGEREEKLAKMEREPYSGSEGETSKAPSKRK